MSDTMPIRVTVLENWDEIALDASPDTSVAEVKRLALAAARASGGTSDYLVKYLGAELVNEAGSLSASGVVPNGALIVMRRRRQPSR